MRKLTTFLKYKFKSAETIIDYTNEYEYLLPFNKKIIPSIKYSK